MSKSFRLQENVYNTYKLLKTKKSKQEFLEKCVLFAFENVEFSSNYDVEIAFQGVKPSIKLTENGGGKNNPNGNNQFNNPDEDSKINKEVGQSDLTTRTELGQSKDSRYKDISNKDISIKNNKFIKPSLEEIKNYCIERKNNVNEEKFFNYYESNGWKVGKNSMKDWKAAIRTWEKNSFEIKKEDRVIW